MDGGGAAGSPTNVTNGAKDSYWARDSQGDDMVYTTESLLRCVAL